MLLVKKLRVDFVDTDPSTLETKRTPCWEWDGKQIRELDGWATQFRHIIWHKPLTPKDGLAFLKALRHAVRGTYVGASDPYEVDD
jgi:hypothetical protein